MDENRLIEQYGLHESLKFQTADGHIWFDQARMLLLHAAALGELRRELIDQLGSSTAKGMLWRLGFRGGRLDASVAAKRATRADDYDSFRLGPAIHALEGIVKSEIVDLAIDWEAATLEGILQWTSSWEAEAHCELQLPLDEADPTACWSITGYASGYVSEFFKRLIVFRETECACAGHARCTVIAKPADGWDDAALIEQLWLEHGDIRRLEAEQELRLLRRQARKRTDAAPSADARPIIGASPAFTKAFSLLGKAAQSSINVLLLGETGVGKEVFARWLHENGPRAAGPFVAINCAAIPLDLVEAELFGVRRGAYTGADETRPGRFERADGGTLFLDEVGDLPLAAQVKLLRVLQTGELERLGDTRPIKVDVRIVSATNAQLEEAIREGRFRSDLYYRLATYPVSIPPLRERGRDVGLLARMLVDRFAPVYGKHVPGLTDHALWTLEGYEWPGNVRELENVIERAVLLGDDGQDIGTEHLPPELLQGEEGSIGVNRGGTLVHKPAPACEKMLEDLLVEGFDLAAHEQMMVELALRKTGGNLADAARMLNLSKRQLTYRLNKQGA
ncbi:MULTISPECIES: sigma-54-dependent Fis family transcriptional regulator [Sphingomonadaceae]|uniref:Sigma 54-interacting transcriptional regulator n=1 Tax=Rhizorhabdus wittichii TaxID=160791 RepID=A0A975D8N5_9SPHN|nr:MULTISPECIES: sigma-54-dependent Fis family transcriptional regulator [Sphingomonadaceae]QTH24799.1 sigma 54-interacting transcriptional regulator [Rhizorhabdus wittichii]QUM74456.1 sigma 54-interacting transcriptional regulator [Sphingopyxis granuli]